MINLLDFSILSTGITTIIWIVVRLSELSSVKSAGRPRHDFKEKIVNYYDHTRPIKDVIKFMESRTLHEVFLCGRMFRVSSVQNTFKKIRFFEVGDTHTSNATLIHIGDFDTTDSWALKALYTALKDDANAKEVIAQLVVLRMKL